MSFRLSLAITLFAVIFTAACTNKSTGTNTANSSPTATPDKPDEFAAVRATYAKNCVLCHQKKGEGGPVKLDDGTKLKVPSLREGHALRHPNSDFVKQITKGGDGMPAFGEKLSPKEIDDLISFIRHEFQGGIAPPAEPAKK